MSLVTRNILWVMALSTLFFNASVAGGRYENPPESMVEVFQLTQQSAEAIKQGDKEAALDAAAQGQKLAYTSNKTRSTMPMSVASTNLKAAIAALKADNLTEAAAKVDHVLKKLTDEIDYYKKEGKL